MFTLTVQNEIIDLYQGGTSTRRIARAYKVGEPKIVQVLSENNILLRESEFARPYHKINNDVIERYKNGMSKNRIMKMFKISEATLTKILCGAGLTLRQKTKKTEAEIKDMMNFFLRSGNIAKTAKVHGVSTNYVRRRLIENKLHKPTKKKSYIDKQTKDEIVAQYKNGYKINEIAVNLCISPTTVRRLLDKRNVRNPIPYRRITMSDHNEIINKRKQGYSLARIAEFFNISESTVSKIVAGKGNEIRTIIEDEKEQEVIKKCKLGIPLARIARDLDVPITQVRRISAEQSCMS